MRTMIATSLLALLVACGGGGADAQLEAAQTKLGSGDFAGAIAAADAGLGADADKAVAFRLERIRLEAQAKGGHEAETIATLERLAGAYPAQIKGESYVEAADWYKESGAESAVAILDAGAKRFPEDTEIASAIEAAKAGGSPEELKMLEQLGYID